MPEVLKIDPRKPDELIIARAVEILSEGGVIAYPTETFYGLGADGENEEAIKKIFLIKKRDRTNPIPVIIGDESRLKHLVADIPGNAHALMKNFWPGPLTLVFRTSQNVSPLLTAGTGKIGIRISSHPIATLLAKGLSRALTATSANISDAEECTTAEEVLHHLGKRIAAVIDGGKTPGGTGSTILDITETPPVILRKGAVSVSKIKNTLKKI
jgi:L-threonylcarbamoyladenylate synthase